MHIDLRSSSDRLLLRTSLPASARHHVRIRNRVVARAIAKLIARPDNAFSELHQARAGERAAVEHCQRRPPERVPLDTRPSKRPSARRRDRPLSGRGLQQRQRLRPNRRLGIHQEHLGNFPRIGAFRCLFRPSGALQPLNI